MTRNPYINLLNLQGVFYLFPEKPPPAGEQAPQGQGVSEANPDVGSPKHNNCCEATTVVIGSVVITVVAKQLLL